MSTKKIALTLAALAAVGTFATPGEADDTGFASMHDMRREAGRLCFTDHYHFGNGAGSSKASAQKEAISSWQSFTAFEYGSDWASFRKAAGKRISCSPNGGSGFDCQIEARPCK